MLSDSVKATGDAKEVLEARHIDRQVLQYASAFVEMPPMH